MQQQACVYVLGDSELGREGLKRILSEGRFSASCSPLLRLPECLDELEDDAGRIVLIETDDAAKAVAAGRVVRERLKKVRLVLLGAGCDAPTAREALAIGVDGYLDRQTSCVPLLLMMELVSLGERVLTAPFVEKLASGSPSPQPTSWSPVEPDHDLSNRELEILRCLVDGDPNKVIARKLGITEATVKIHVKGILRKLHVLNRTQAAIWMVNSGLCEVRRPN